MIDDELASVLSDACEWARASGNDPGRNWFRDDFKERLSAIESVLSRDDTFRTIDGKYIRSGAGYAQITTGFTAGRLLSRSFETGDVARTIADMREFLANPSIPVLGILTITGVRIESELVLTNRTSIVPPELLPASENRSRFFLSNEQRKYQRIVAPTAPIADAALVFRWTLTDAITDNPLNPAPLKDQEAQDAEFERALAALMLCCGDGIQQIHRYAEHLHPGHLWPSGGYSEHPIVANYRDPQILTAADQQRLAEDCTTKFSDWPEFWRLVRRLNAARLKHDLVDGHIDLGIVAECALTKGDRRESEISHRLRTRSAWLLGSNGIERRQIAKSMNALYGRRSSAAHTGKIDDASRKTLDADAALCVDLLRCILRRGRFPTADDWPAIIYG